jgi:hypothetical protein
VSPVKYEQGFYIPEDDILHSHRMLQTLSPSVRPCRHVVARSCSKWLRAGRRKGRSSIPGRFKSCSLPNVVQTSSGAHPASCTLGTGLKQPELPSQRVNRKLKNRGAVIYIATHPHGMMLN